MARSYLLVVCIMGYAGTHEDSPLWVGIRYKDLVSEEQFWPAWDPCKWVLDP